MTESSTSGDLARRSFRVSETLCFVAMIFPLLTAVGWIAGLPLLTRGPAMLPVMHPNTALGLFLGALAVLSTRERAAGRHAVAALILASAMLLLGLLTLGEYSFGWNIGIDRIFVRSAPTLDQPFPGRPSPESSLNFVLLGAAIILFNLTPRRVYLGQISALLVAANAVLAVTGYIFGSRNFFGFPISSVATGMAWHTAVTFTLLVVALFCSRPTSGMMTLITEGTRAGAMAKRILLATILLPPLIGALTRLGVVFGWYDVGHQISIFAFAMIGLILRTTWRAARQSEREELLARAATETVQRANEELRRAVEERQIFAAFIENSPDFIGIADAKGTPTYINPAGRRMVGLAGDFSIEHTEIADYYPPDQRAFASNVIVKSMLERGHWEGETALRHWQTGQALPVSDAHFMIRSPDNRQILGMGTITRDISEIKRAHEALEAAHQRYQLANEELTRLNEKAKELDQLKTQLFASISHELRTPLTLILGPIEKHLGSSRALGVDRRQDLQVVKRNACTILQHVNDLLDVARLNAGRVQPEYTDEDAAALVRFMADHFSALAKEKSIQFAVEAPAALPVQVDADKLQRILLHLLSNAFTFTPNGGRVRLSLRKTDDRFWIEVGNSGSGIPEETRGEVFDRFQQLETDAARRFGGTGLGLSIVKDFAALLGGSISAAGAPEGVALLRLDLPCAAPPGTEFGPRVGGGADTHDIEQMVDRLRDGRPWQTTDHIPEAARDGLVLVVEDNHDMSRFIADSLERRGFRVAVAFDGRNGYEKAIALRPDLVLTEVMMPVTNDGELVRALRERDELDSTPIVALTAKADQQSRVRVLRDGAQDYLEKPFLVEELCARVQNLVARKRADDHSKRMRQQVEDVARASLSVSNAVGGVPEASLRSVLEILALNARNLTSAEFAAAGIGGSPDRPFDPWVFAGMNRGLAEKIGPPPRSLGVLGLVTKEDRVVRARDLRQLPEHRDFPPGHPVMTSFLGVPIRHRGHAVGNLYLANKQDGPEFTEHDQRLIEMLAGRAGGAIEAAQLFAAEGVTRAWLQAVIDQMPEGIVLMDAEGRVILKNRSMASLAPTASPERDRYGNPITVDLRRPSGERLSPDNFPIIKAIVDKVTFRGSELVARRSDGRMIPLVVSAAPILGDHGELVGATMICQDVSTLEELEQLGEETASLVAHDLQQPIGTIVLRSDFLLRGKLTSTQQEDVREMRNSAKRLSRMVNDLMDASQLESRHLRIALGRLDLGQFVREVVGRVPGAATRTEIRTPENSRLFVKGDAQRLEQVVTNLLSNALKYSTEGTEIRVDVKENPTYSEVQVSVSNRGPGIPAHELPSLFARFARVGGARISATKVSGLGLYIAKGLIEAQGGRMWAESAPGQTTTFHFTIPLDGPPEPIAALPSADAALYGWH